MSRLDGGLVDRLEHVAAAFSVARVEALAALAGNPLGLELARFGDVFAPAALAVPELDFVNRIERLGPANASRLGEILGFYAERGVRPWLESRPDTRLTFPCAVELEGTHAVVHGAAEAGGEPALPTREAEPEPAARLLLDAFGVPPAVAERHASALAAAAGRCGGRFFVAELDGAIAGAAVLTIEDGGAHLAMGGTLAAFRGRGCQTALIAARLRAARDARCAVVTSGAEFGSQSHRNLERAGLRLAYTKPVLRITPPRAA